MSTVHDCGNSAVRVGIVSYNTAALLDRCLASLPAALGDVNAEIVVVDNSSSDDSAAVAARFASAGIRLVRNVQNIGYSRAMNQALGGTAAEVLMALNPDTEPRPGSLAFLVEALRTDPRAGLVVPRLLNPDGTLQHSVHRFPSVTVAVAMGLVPMRLRAAQGAWFGRRFWLEGFAPHDHSGDVDWAVGAVHAIRRAALRDPDRPYSEQSFMYGEDLDLCWQLHRDGWRVLLEPRAEVVHVGNAAGAEAWGDAKDARVLDATYGWYAARRGAAAARALAGANVVGLVAKLAAVHALAVRRPEQRHHSERLARLCRMHGAKLVHPDRPLCRDD